MSRGSRVRPTFLPDTSGVRVVRGDGYAEAFDRPYHDGHSYVARTCPASQPTDALGRWPVRSLGRFHKPWDYDHVVAVLGSSPHHVATADLVLRVPCHIWLHEASLVGVHLGLAHASGSVSWALADVREVLESTESPGLVELLDDDALLDAPHLDAVGVTLLAATLRQARSVIVSSERAADVVRSIRSDGPPLLVLPLAYPDMGVRERSAPQSLDIVAVGWLAPNKAPADAVEALARLVPTCDARLTFVGPTVDSGVTAGGIGSEPTRRDRSGHDRWSSRRRRISAPGRSGASRSAAPVERPRRNVGGRHRSRRTRNTDAHDPGNSRTIFTRPDGRRTRRRLDRDCAGPAADRRHCLANRVE